ncbi:MAG: C25 family cysteine peptidase [Chloroflexota bacterium]
MNDKRLIFSGLNGATGMPLAAAKPDDDYVDWILAEDQATPQTEKDGRHNDWAALRPKVLGTTIQGINKRDVSQARWGLIYPQSQPEIAEALKDLVAQRHGSQYAYNGEDYRAFITGHGQGPGPVDPANLPYYLLIAGLPEQIPFRFQYGLDAKYAVGRVCFENIQDYGSYAQSVLEYESAQGPLPRQRQVVLFSPTSPGDEATLRSDKWLAERLANAIHQKTLKSSQGNPYQYQAQHLRGAAATRQTLLDTLTGGQQSVVFSACHGVAFPKGHPVQKSDQGALVCADWPGPVNWPENTGLPESMYLAGRHLPSESRLDGQVIFTFACYSAGTPQLGDFEHFDYYKPEELAAQAFAAGLPQRLLAQGALAFLGHVDRVWDYSYLWSNVQNNTSTFQSTLEAILVGDPIGLAFDYFNQRYLDLNEWLTGSNEQHLINRYLAGAAGPPELVDYWTARNDARAYVLFGDPAVRLRPHLMQ